jgi:hypothetical protein
MTSGVIDAGPPRLDDARMLKMAFAGTFAGSREAPVRPKRAATLIKPTPACRPFHELANVPMSRASSPSTSTGSPAASRR